MVVLFIASFRSLLFTFVCSQILETIPISNEVTDLVQKLGNFYTEVESNGEDVEENEVDKRPFTRPFAKYTGTGSAMQ